jgi:hypothetical protein
VRTDFLGELIAFIIRVTRIGKLETLEVFSPKRRFLQEQHSDIKNMAFFIVTAVKTSSLT